MFANMGKRQKTSILLEKRKKNTNEFLTLYHRHVQSVLDDDMNKMKFFQNAQSNAMQSLIDADINTLFVSAKNMTTLEFCTAFIESIGIAHMNNIYQLKNNMVMSRGMDGEFSVYDIPRTRCRMRVLDRPIASASNTTLSSALMEPKDLTFQKIRSFADLSLKMAASQVVAPIVLMSIIPEFLSDKMNVETARNIVKKNAWLHRQNSDWKNAMQNPVESRYDVRQINARHYEKDTLTGTTMRQRVLPQEQMAVVNRKLKAGFVYVTCLSETMWRNTKSIAKDSPNSKTMELLGDHIVAMCSRMLGNNVAVLGFTLEQILVHFNAKTGRPIRCLLESAPFVGLNEIIRVRKTNAAYESMLKKYEETVALNPNEIALFCMLFYISTLFQILRQNENMQNMNHTMDPLVRKIHSMSSGNAKVCNALLEIGNTAHKNSIYKYINVVYKVWQKHRLMDSDGKIAHNKHMHALAANSENIEEESVHLYEYGSFDDLIQVTLNQIEEHADGFYE